MERRPLLRKKWKGQILTGGTWNTRGWGAKYARIDQHMKSECIFALMAARKWEFALLTDIRFESNGVREYDTTRGKWIVVVQGKVGVAWLDDAVIRCGQMWGFVSCGMSTLRVFVTRTVL